MSSFRLSQVCLPSRLLLLGLLAVFWIPGLLAAEEASRALVWADASEHSSFYGLPELNVRQELPAAVVVEGSQEAIDELTAAGYLLKMLPDRHEVMLRGGVVDLRDLPLPLKDLPPAGEKAPFLVGFDGVPTPAFKERLIELGAEIVGPIPPAAYLIRADGAALNAVRALPEVVGATAWRSEWKISGRVPPGPLSQTVEVNLFPGVEAGDAARKAASFGRILRSYPLTNRSAFTVELKAGALEDVARLPEVEWIDAMAPPGLYANAMRVVMQTEKQDPSANQGFYNPIYAIGVWGTGEIITVADSGQVPHEVFADPNLITNYSLASCVTGPGDLGNHGTSVAAVAVGDKEWLGAYDTANDYDGLAVGAQLLVQDWDNDTTNGCMPDDGLEMVVDYFYPAFLAGSMIHNNSWGHGGDTNEGFGIYSAISQTIDAYLSDFNYREQVVVFAAGNGGATYPGQVYFPYSTSDEAHAKNVISVGGSNNGNARHLMYLYASRGPTNDCGVARANLPCPDLGRIKPDVVAPAINVEAAWATGYSVYDMNEGTSFAAPAVSGAAALVRDYFAQNFYPNDPSDPPLFNKNDPSAALIKAMLVNSTVFLNDPSAFESVGTWNLLADAYPNYDQGYGRPVLDNVLEPAGYRELKVFENTTTYFTASGDVWEQSVPINNVWNANCNTLRATLAWPDPPMTLGAGKALVHDLDLEVDYGGRTYRGNHRLTGGAVPDTLNNVEDVLLTMGTVANPPTPVVRVKASSVQAFQPFAVVLTYGACFDNVPCQQSSPVGGCYRGPGDVVPQPGPPPVPSCSDQVYDPTSYSGNDPSPFCKPCPNSDVSLSVTIPAPGDGPIQEYCPVVQVPHQL